jgi:hypothetical protein
MYLERKHIIENLLFVLVDRVLMFSLGFKAGQGSLDVRDVLQVE